MTLIETLLTVLIISLLAAASIPLFANAIRQSRSTALAAQAEKLYEALITYHVDHGRFPSEGDFDLETLEPLSTDGYFPDPGAFTDKLFGKRLLVYVAPDVSGVDQQFIAVARHAADSSIIIAIVYTNVIHATDGWVDGVYVISEGDLKEADEI